MNRQWMAVMGLVVAVAVPGVATQGRVVDDGWCREDRSGNSDREQACEVREMTLPVGSSAVAVDAAPNGGIEVSGSVRGDIVVRAKITASAASAVLPLPVRSTMPVRS